MLIAATATSNVPFASDRSHAPLPGHPGLKEYLWKQDTVSVHPAATPGSKSLENQKALLKAGQEMNQ